MVSELISMCAGSLLLLKSLSNVFLGLKTYFILGRKSDLNGEESTAGGLTTMWLDEVESETASQLQIVSHKNAPGSNCGSTSKKACSMPSILDEVANSSDSNSNLQEARTTRSVSQDRKKRNVYHAQRSQQDELTPLSFTG